MEIVSRKKINPFDTQSFWTNLMARLKTTQQSFLIDGGHIKNKTRSKIVNEEPQEHEIEFIDHFGRQDMLVVPQENLTMGQTQILHEVHSNSSHLLLDKPTGVESRNAYTTLQGNLPLKGGLRTSIYDSNCVTSIGAGSTTHLKQKQRPDTSIKQTAMFAPTSTLDMRFSQNSALNSR